MQGCGLATHFCEVRALCRKCVSNPFDSCGFASHFGNGEHIEAHAEVGELAVLLEELACGPNQAHLFAGIDAGRRPTEPVTGPAAYFGDHQDIALSRHDVQLTQTAQVIALKDLETLGPEKIGGELFSGGAKKLIRGSADRKSVV